MIAKTLPRERKTVQTHNHRGLLNRSKDLPQSPPPKDQWKIPYAAQKSKEAAPRKTSKRKGLYTYGHPLKERLLARLGVCCLCVLSPSQCPHETHGCTNMFGVSAHTLHRSNGLMFHLCYSSQRRLSLIPLHVMKLSRSNALHAPPNYDSFAH